jgi:hypothetical protein
MSDLELPIGRRVQLADQRYGYIRFRGKTRFQTGEWVGVELDDDSGKNDGSVNGVRYFECEMGHGMFVRTTALRILEEPAHPLFPQPKKKGRPSSMVSASSRGSAPADPGLTKRISMNAPSPTPTQKPQSRTLSGIRVSPLLHIGKSATLTVFALVAHQIAHEAAGHCALERSPVPYHNPFQCQTGSGSSLPPVHRIGPTLHGAASDADQTGSAGFIGRRAQDHGPPCTYPEWPTGCSSQTQYRSSICRSGFLGRAPGICQDSNRQTLELEQRCVRPEEQR